MKISQVPIAPTSRPDFEKLIEVRLREASILIAQKEWDGAYYLAGYVVEYALKVKIIIDLMKSDSFPDKGLANNFYTHDLRELRNLAKLTDEMKKNVPVSVQWSVVTLWNEQIRYAVGKTEQEAVSLYEAIEKEVLPWIKAQW